MVELKKPQWLVDERPDMVAVMEVAKAEAERNPNMLLSEFIKNFNEVIIAETYDRNHRVVMSQFEKESV